MKKNSMDAVPTVATQLHDGACQTLTALHLHATVLARKVRRACPEFGADLDNLEKLIERARTELNVVVKRAR